MLRSFEYTEIPYKRDSFQSDFLREKEIKIAHEFVMQHKGKNIISKLCPICNKGQGEYFYTKWGMDYVRCDNCKSVFALCDIDNLELYKKSKELLQLRTSEEYQQEIIDRREEAWTEFLEWVQVRSFRFMHRNTNLSIIDFGNRYKGYTEAIQKSQLCGEYNLRQTILQEDEKSIQHADIVFCLDQLQQESKPEKLLRKMRIQLKDDGLLFIGTRAGSGFDILTLKESNPRIYPYEHVMLPSLDGLITCINNAGYEILEVTTPGIMDVQYVLENKDEIKSDDTFVQYMIQQSDDKVLQEFQRFLQKSGLSSFVRIIARKVPTR